MYDVDAVVVGAGVVGLAIGRELAGAGIETLVLEKLDAFGKETSSRNSEVIHAGIHYPLGSLKAGLCAAGKIRLYGFCRERAVPHRRIGKIIFAATENERPALDRILELAIRNGVGDLVVLSREQAASLEPELSCDSAILSPSTGIVDSHALMLSLLADIEDRGGRLVCNTNVERVSRVPDGGWAIHVTGEGSAPVLRTKYLVNSAGLGAHVLAAATEGFPSDSLPPLRFARGVYYDYSGHMPFEHLIYPIPDEAGLGIHLTMDLGGNARFGPDVEWTDQVDYAIGADPSRDDRFYAAARAIYPAVDRSRLSPSFAGVRAKLSGFADAPADFAILGPAEHGLANHIALFGIESPGLTASLAIAAMVGRELDLPASEQVVA